MAVEQVTEVGRGLVMEGFVCEEKDFELNSLWDREPVEVPEDRGDVVSLFKVLDVVPYRMLHRYMICNEYFT